MYAWDNSPNTASGLDGGLPSTTGAQDCSFAVQNDVFFVWTSECCGE